jgi:hypothetical protein
LLFLLLSLLGGFECHAQTGVKVYNEKLVPLSYDSLLAQSKSIAFVTNISCGGCVEYLAKENVCKTFIYFIDNLSIMEMNRVKFQNDPSCKFYFVLCGFEAGSIRYSEKSPLLVVNAENTVSIYDYMKLNQLTKEFSLKGRKARKTLGL